MERGNLVVTSGDFVKERTGAIRDTYRIGGKLGDGAFGSVRKITHRVTGEVRAVKTIHKKSLRTPEEQATFFNEVSVLRALDHPSILKLYEFYQDDKNYYLITEFCAGGELYDRIINAGSFSEAVAAGIMRQILSCIMFCHSKGVVHRDLKPENFLFENSSPNSPLKVIDFGTAQFFTPGQVLTAKFGTPYYIAPEVLRKHYNEKCDIWSAGVNMYILLCGFPPFGGNSDEQILKKVAAGRFNFPSPEWDSISAEAKDLITMMLTLDLDRRPTAREALSHRWLQHASHEPLNASSASGIFRNLQSFKTERTLQKATLTFIASQLSTNAEKADMITIFQSLDSDNSGTLSRDELIRGFEQLFGAQVEDVESEVDRIMEEVDTDRSGEIDYTEFAIATMNRQKLVSREHLETAFRAFDLDGNGTISKDELRTMLGGNKHYSDEVWEGIVKEVDQNGDGVIDFREFMDMMMRYNR
jgi:calcium-dependent protein kinase